VSAIEAEKKALKLNPFLWKSYESLCNLGEFSLAPDTVFSLEGVDSLQDCHGANPLVNFLNSFSAEGVAAAAEPGDGGSLGGGQPAPPYSNLSRICQTPQQNSSHVSAYNTSFGCVRYRCI
jgi:hypothetical protein